MMRVYAPGRSEIAGNHVDHQGGRVIAAAVNCGVEAVVQGGGVACCTPAVRVESRGFAPVALPLEGAWQEPREQERGTTAALVRGVCAGMARLGVDVRGFGLRVSSTVPVGGGLSSSAAFEVALAHAVNMLFADGAVETGSLVRVAVEAEREWFGKPCGYMDQTASAYGGCVRIDFRDVVAGTAPSPAVERLPLDLGAFGYALVLVDTHCDHSLYEDEFSQLVEDLHAVAAELGAPGLQLAGEAAFYERFADLRARLGDRPVLRALNYFREVRLVDARAAALRAGDFDAFLAATCASGAGSAQFLQNISVPGAGEQPAMVALAVVEHALAGRGACRIHGGGFGGTIQAFVPLDALDAFTQDVDALLGAGSCAVYSIDAKGVRTL